jgi:pSer/pThr/pTyr-binding forkhead associated (FHA) protein
MVEAPENAAAFSRLRAGPRVAHWRGVETMLEIETSYAGETTTATFATFPVHVGRDEASELHLPYAFVSRSHARIERDGDGFVIVDEGSRNGITVRGEKVARGERAALVDGAIVTIEGVVVRVQFREQTQPMVRPDNMTSVYADELLVPAILAQASAVSESIAALGAVLEKVPTSRRSTIIRQLVGQRQRRGQRSVGCAQRGPEIRADLRPS